MTVKCSCPCWVRSVSEVAQTAGRVCLSWVEMFSTSYLINNIFIQLCILVNVYDYISEIVIETIIYGLFKCQPIIQNHSINYQVKYSARQRF